MSNYSVLKHRLKIACRACSLRVIPEIKEFHQSSSVVLCKCTIFGHLLQTIIKILSMKNLYSFLRNGIFVIMNISANISAMHAASFSMNTSSHNVANLATEDFKSLEVLQTEGIDGGPQVESFRTDRGTDINHEILKQKRIMYDFKANAAVVRMRDELIGNTIDLLA